ncbi:MAG TPA: carboxylesterase family protein [Arachidicoccus sp.]|nr:carboxylesterase family protein [Arachidicoccus sp.]
MSIRNKALFFGIINCISLCTLQQPIYAQSANKPIVKTAAGYIRGVQENNCFVFKGIPYAAPPTGARRFLPPVPHTHWKDTLECVTFGSPSAQYGNNEKPVNGSEDGLFLNVYTPSISPKAKMPILIWVHGGSMVAGSGMGENGHAFADRDSIVTVTINYRLGVFGFLYLGDLGVPYRTSGNNGLLDLIQSLKWVKENIKALGGDPDRVTVMGESAGAKLSSALIATPLAEGLFSGVILESGGFQCIRDTTTAIGIRTRLMDKLKVKEPKDLLKLPTAQLIKAQAAVLVGAQGTNYFGPVMDGIVLQDSPYSYIDQQGKDKVHYLLGANQAESRGFMDIDTRLYHPDTTVIRDWFGINYPHVLQSYQQRLKKTQNDTTAAMDILSEYMYKMHTYRLADRLAKNNRSTFVYRFAFTEEREPATHGGELKFVWYLPEQENYTTLEKKFGPELHKYWVNFIRNGDPGTVNNVNWPMYKSDNHSIIVLDKVTRPEQLKQIFNNPEAPSACFLLN